MRSFKVTTGFLVLGYAIACSAPREIRQGPEASLYPQQVLALEERKLEAALKLARVLDFLKREQLAGVLIQTSANAEWITGGSCGEGIIIGEIAVIPLLICADGRKYFITGQGKASGLVRDDLKAMGFEPKEIPWYRDDPESSRLGAIAQKLTGGRVLGSDKPVAGARFVQDEMTALRVPLTDTEMRKYRWLGKNCGEAMVSVCRLIQSGMTERGLEALLADELLRRAIQPITVEVSADAPVMPASSAFPPGTNKVEKHACARIVARRWGVVVEMTRAVSLGRAADELRRKMVAVAHVNAGFWARTIPDATAGAILQGAIADYAEVEFPDAWRRQPPGGAIGYRERDWVASPGSGRKVQANQTFIWRSAVDGLEVADTILLAGDRLEVLTEISGWPVVEVKKFGRIYRVPDILAR